MIDQMAANLATTMECFVRFQPGTSVTQLSGITIVDAGADNASFNSVLLNAHIDNEHTFENCIHAASQYFRLRSSAWSFWVCEGLLSNTVRRKMDSIFQRHRMQLTAATSGLGAELLKAPSRSLPQLKIRRVKDAESKSSFCHVMTTSFESPAEQLTRVYSGDMVWKTPFQGFIGSIDGQDVSAGAIVIAHDVAGIYAVGTLPPFRRRGYAEALMRQTIDETFQQHGPLPLVLQSTPAALNLYRRMGFRSVTNFSLYTSQ